MTTLARRDDDELGLRPTLGPAGAHHGHDLLADAEAIDALAHGLHRAGGIHARHPRRRQVVAGAALAQDDIGGVYGRGLDGDAYLVRPRLADRTIGHAEDLRASGLGNHYGTHNCTSTVDSTQDRQLVTRR